MAETNDRIECMPELEPSLEVNLQQIYGSNKERLGETKIREKRICFYAIVFTVNIIVSVGFSFLLIRYMSYPVVVNDVLAFINRSNVCFPYTIKELQVQRVSSDSFTPNFLCSSLYDEQIRKLVAENVVHLFRDEVKGQNLYHILNTQLLPKAINQNAVHVFLKFPRGLRKNRSFQAVSELQEFVTLREWKSDGDSAFLRQGIEFNFTCGHFTVKDAGVYVVYSRIVYENNGVSSHTNKDTSSVQRVIIGHRISLYVKNRYRDVVEDEQVIECNVDGAVCYNSNIFSTLHLTKDSQIAVRVREVQLVSQRSQVSYFGLYRID